MTANQRDFGLENFIGKYGFTVAEKDVGSLTKLTLTNSSKYIDSLISGPLYYELKSTIDGVYRCLGGSSLSIEVILSGELVVGAAQRLNPSETPFLISTRKENACFGFLLSHDHIYAGAKGNENEVLDFEQFLSIGSNPHSSESRYGLGEQDAHVTNYIDGEGVASPTSFSFGPHNFLSFLDYVRNLCEDQFEFFPDDIGYTVSWGEGDTIIKARFPKLIAPEQFQEMRTLANSETGWLELPRRVPILTYSRTVKLDKPA